LFTDL